MRDATSRAAGQVLLEGEYLYRTLDSSDAMFFIKRGAVQIEREEADGSGCVVAIVPAGEHFGELTMFTGERRERSARAKVDCILFCLTLEAFDGTMRAFPQWAEQTRSADPLPCSRSSR